MPYEESERLIFLNEKSPVLDEMSISYPNFTDWREQNQSFEKIGVYNRARSVSISARFAIRDFFRHY